MPYLGQMTLVEQLEVCLTQQLERHLETCVEEDNIDGYWFAFTGVRIKCPPLLFSS